MGMGESQLPSHPKSHPKSHHPIPFAIIPSQSQIPSQIPFKSSGRRRIKIPPFEPALRDESNGIFPFFYDYWMPSLLAKCHQIGIITFNTAPFDVSLNIST